MANANNTQKPSRKVSNVCCGCGKRSASDWCAPCGRAQLAHEESLLKQMAAEPTLLACVVGRVLTLARLVAHGTFARPATVASPVPAQRRARAKKVAPVVVVPELPFDAERHQAVAERAWEAHVAARGGLQAITGEHQARARENQKGQVKLRMVTPLPTNQTVVDASSAAPAPVKFRTPRAARAAGSKR